MMKRLLTGTAALLTSTAALCATMIPSSMINWVSVPTWPSVSAGLVFAGPTTMTGAPTFRSLAAGDLPVVPVSKGGTNATAAGGTALDNITGFSGTGFVKRTGSGAYAFVADPLPVANGGTGAATVAAARTALGAAASGANTDITSLNAPALGAATATTAAAGTSTTQVATTAFAQTAITGGGSAAKFTSLALTASAKVLAVNTSAQSIPNNANTVVTGWTAAVNQNSNFVDSTGIFTAPRAGFYQVSASIGFASAAFSAGQNVAVVILKNGTAVVQGARTVETTVTTPQYAPPTSVLLQCAQGDTISIAAFQNSGSAVALNSGGTIVYLSISEAP
ncbi:TPA: hypothetical protein QDA84_001703 [Burkholderia vietnamiensis]|nr:hypothetical protein [Burkholderia vietnamiensis]